MKNRKQQFMRAVQTLTPDDHFIHQLAQHIPEERLPVAPGGVALEFVVAMQRFKVPVNDTPATPYRLSMSHVLRVKSAEFWLKLGEADQALRELEALPESTWNHPSAVKTCVAALGALRERAETVVQE